MGRSPGAYRSEKRGKELLRRKKQEEKQRRRLARAAGAASVPTTPEAPPPALEPQEIPTTLNSARNACAAKARF